MCARSAAVAKAIPALVTLAGGIGDVQVRHRGTIGGSVANNDPAADYPAGCLGLGATIVTTKREIAADDFFTALFTTALEADEIITAIRFPVPERAAYMKFKNPASRYAIVGAFVSKGADGVRVAITGAGDNGVFRVPAMEQALAKSFHAGRDRRHHDPDRHIAQRHPRERRVSRASHRRDGQTRCYGVRVRETAGKIPDCSRQCPNWCLALLA